MAKAKEQEKKLGIDEMFQKIEEQISLLEKEDISLEDALSAYEEGIHYIKECKDSITGVEQKIMLLRQDGEADEL